MAMGGWSGSFKHQYNLQNFQLSSEAVTADEKEAKDFPAETQNLTGEECYTLVNVFSCDAEAEAPVLWPPDEKN